MTKQFRKSAIGFLTAGIFLITISITNGQNVGIGTTTPAQKLDVAGNVQFTGALMPASNAGTLGNSLLSSGAGLAPIWASATQGQQFIVKLNTLNTGIKKSQGYVLITGMSQTITVPSTGSYDIFIYTDGGMDWIGSTTSESNECIYPEVSIWIDGVLVKSVVYQLANFANVIDMIMGWSFIHFQTLTAGSHTIEVKGRIYATETGLSDAKSKVFFGAPDYASSGLFYYANGWLVISLIEK